MTITFFMTYRQNEFLKRGRGSLSKLKEDLGGRFLLDLLFRETLVLLALQLKISLSLKKLKEANPRAESIQVDRNNLNAFLAATRVNFQPSAHS